MKTYTKKLESFAYISIFVLLFIILICIAKYNYKNVDQLNIRQVTNQNSNKEGMCNKQKKHIREGMEDINKIDLDFKRHDGCLEHAFERCVLNFCKSYVFL